MALNTFGWTPSEVTTDSAGNVISGVTLTVFTDVTKATQVTSLYDKDGVTALANGVVVSDNKGRFGFKASDAYSMLYVYDGSTADPWPIAAHEALDAGMASHAQAVADAQAAADSAAASAALVNAPADTAMKTIVTNPATQTGAYLSAAFGRATPALTAFKGALAAGQTTGYQVLGDSTGDASFEWPYTFAQSLATAYPAYTVKHMLWNDTTQLFDAPTTLQTGPNGPRVMNIVTGQYPRKLDTAAAPHVTGTVDIQVKATSTDWSMTNPYGGTILVSEGGGSGAWGWNLMMHQSGYISFQYSTTGSDLVGINSPGIPAIADGATKWIRCVFTPDDGAGNKVAKFYTSDDGVAWTQVGTNVTSAGVVTLKDQITPGGAYLLGGTGAAQVSGWSIHEVKIRNGQDGPIINPVLPDLWGQYGSGTTHGMSGSPVLTIVNGSKSGGTIAYLDDVTRRPKMTPDFGQALTFLSSSHNETRKSGRSWYTAYAAWVANVRARLGTGIVGLTQNPERPGAIYNVEHGRRHSDLLAFGNGLNIDVIDTYAKFTASPTWATDWMNDDVHPNTAGQVVWRDAIKAAFDA